MASFVRTNSLLGSGYTIKDTSQILCLNLTKFTILHHVILFVNTTIGSICQNFDNSVAIFT